MTKKDVEYTAAVMQMTADVIEVFERHKADTRKVMVVALNLMESAYSQIVDDNPQVDAAQLANDIAQMVLRHLRGAKPSHEGMMEN